MKDRLAVMALALWWGSLTALAGFVVPMLFANLPSPALAGNMAGKLFSVQNWVSLACGLSVLLIYGKNQGFPRAKRSYDAIELIAFSMLSALVIEFGVSPRILARDQLKLWHTAGSVLYAVQWLCVGLLLWRATRQPAS